MRNPRSARCRRYGNTPRSPGISGLGWWTRVSAAGREANCPRCGLGDLHVCDLFHWYENAPALVVFECQRAARDHRVGHHLLDLGTRLIAIEHQLAVCVLHADLDLHEVLQFLPCPVLLCPAQGRSRDDVASRAEIASVWQG